MEKDVGHLSLRSIYGRQRWKTDRMIEVGSRRHLWLALIRDTHEVDLACRDRGFHNGREFGLVQWACFA